MPFVAFSFSGSMALLSFSSSCLRFSWGLALLLSLSNPAWAEKADRQKPLNAEADALRYDDAKQTSIFTGNVVATKGTLIIRGDRVEVRQDNEGYQFANIVSTGAKRAFYRQKRDGVDEWIEGEAETIFYDGKADVVTFTKAAVMRRYRGTQVSDETQGAVITYDNVTDVFNVTGGANSGTGAPGSPSAGRIKAVLSPKPSASSPVATPAPTPANLRQSQTLGGERK
jgi:lipopolysaccharide export system protein LptA